jgi:hypothetical protein
VTQSCQYKRGKEEALTFLRFVDTGSRMSVFLGLLKRNIELKSLGGL